MINNNSQNIGGVKVRFIIDLQYINKFMKKYKFKLDTIKVMCQMIIKGDYFISVDLSKAYYHLPVNKEHQPKPAIFIGFYRLEPCPQFSMGIGWGPVPNEE